MMLTVVYKGKKARTKNIIGPEAVYEEMSFLQRADRESMYVLHLDTRLQIISKELISMGTVNESLVHPREVFKGAFLSNATSIILVHNHPSGNPDLSVEDLRITRRLQSVAGIHGIEIVDHIIIGKGGYYSMKAAGTLPDQPKSTAGAGWGLDRSGLIRSSSTTRDSHVAAKSSKEDQLITIEEFDQLYKIVTEASLMLHRLYGRRRDIEWKQSMRRTDRMIAGIRRASKEVKHCVDRNSGEEVPQR